MFNNSSEPAIWDDLPAVCTADNTEFLQDATEEDIAPLLHGKKDSLIVFTIFPIILVFGIATNTLFLLVLLRIKQMRTVTNYYLGHLACCDLAFICLLVGETIYDHAYSPIQHIFYRTREACTFVTFLQHVTLFASINLVTLVGFERFMAICYPVTHRLIGGMKRTQYLTIGAWVLSIVLGAVSAPLFGSMSTLCMIWPNRDPYHSFPVVVNRCGPSHEIFRGFTRGLRLCYFLLAVVISTYMYARIIMRVNNRIQPGSENANHQGKKPNNRVAAMLIANGVVFFVCLAPYRVVEVYVLLAVTGKVGHLNWVNPLAAVGLWTWCVNSTVNPVIYGLTNPRYRKSFWKVMTCSSKTEIDMSVSQATQSLRIQSQIQDK